MPWRCYLFVGYAELALLIESAMKTYTEWQVLARISRWEWRKTCSAGLSTSNKWVMNEWQKRFRTKKWAATDLGWHSKTQYQSYWSEFTQKAWGPSEGHVWRGCWQWSRRKSYAETVAFGVPFSLTIPLGLQREASIIKFIFIFIEYKSPITAAYMLLNIQISL